MDPKWALSKLTAFEDGERGRTRHLKAVLENYRKLIEAHNQLQSGYAQICAEKAEPHTKYRQLQSDFDKLRAEKETVDTERRQVARNYNKLRTEKERSDNERGKTQAKYNKLRIEKEKVENESRVWQSKYEKLFTEKEELGEEFDPCIKTDSSDSQPHDNSAVAKASQKVVVRDQEVSHRAEAAQTFDFFLTNPRTFADFAVNIPGQISLPESAELQAKLLKTKKGDGSQMKSNDDSGAQSSNENAAESSDEDVAESGDEDVAESGDESGEDLIDLGVPLSKKGSSWSLAAED